MNYRPVLDQAAGIRREISADTRRKGRIVFTCTFYYILYLSTCSQRPPSSLKGFSPAALTNSASASDSKSVFVVGAASVGTRRADNTIRAERFFHQRHIETAPRSRAANVSIHHRFAWHFIIKTQQSCCARKKIKGLCFLFCFSTQISAQRNSSRLFLKGNSCPSVS